MSTVSIKNKRGQTFDLLEEGIKIGRAVDNNIVLTDPTISRYHLALQPVSDGVIIYNTGSEAGFYLNNEWFMDSAKAQGGDIIRIGTEEFTVDAPKPEEVAFDFNTTSETSGAPSLSLNSNNKIRGILILVVALMGIAIVLQQNEDKKTNNQEAKGKLTTIELPAESYSNRDTAKLGPQEITANDLYKQGNREMYNKNYIRAIQWYQQSLVEDPSSKKAQNALTDAESELKNAIINQVEISTKNLMENRLQLARSQVRQALDLISEQIPGYSFQVQQKQRSLASQKMPILSRDQLYLELPCDQTPDPNICKRAVDILKRTRILLGEENVLK
jgi:pSer/pThr/pTyr-binding forkhead associated (FHA) protein